MKGVLVFIEDDLEQMEAQWIDEGICQFEALLHSHWLFQFGYPSPDEL